MKIMLHVALLAFTQLAFAQGYPSKPVRLIVGYSLGTVADALARETAARLSRELGQQVYVENRPGAGATIAASGAAHSSADGHALFLADSALLIAPNIYAKLNFDPLKSFAPIGGVAATPLVIVVSPALKADTVADLIAFLKADPGRQAYGSPGIGTVHHLAMERFKRQAGVSIVHVTYKWVGGFIPDLAAGRIAVGIVSVALALEQAQENKLRPLALTSSLKGAGWPALADTLPGFDASPRLFLVAPAGTPEAAVSQLSTALKKILSSTDVQEAFAAHGAVPDWTTPQDLGARMTQDLARWTQAAKDAGIRPE